MSAFDRLKTPPVRLSGSKIQDWINSLPDTDRGLVLAAIVDPAWSHVELTKALIELGMPQVSDKTFGDWRRRNGWKPS